jgi:hypothetical protein
MVERQAGLAARLAAVLRGSDRPKDAQEGLAFAALCQDTGRYASAARLLAGAFEAQPALAEDVKAGHRYTAACAAALAGCGKGRGDPTLSDRERARWRVQALEWLNADLAAWIKLLENPQADARALVRKSLAHWKEVPDLAGLRDPTALNQLSADERKTWQDFWSEVERLLVKVNRQERKAA